MEKMFKYTGDCPYTGNAIDSVPCRQCKWFFRPGTYTFIWCSHPVPERTEEKAKNHITVTQKTAIGKPARPKRKINGNSKQIKPATTPKKRGRPKKAK